jgi:hypothetical protein
MKTQAISQAIDTIMPRKKAVCEPIIDQLKNIFHIEHSRHRSPKNFLANLFLAPIAYNFSEIKPSIMNQFVDTKQQLLKF